MSGSCKYLVVVSELMLLVSFVSVKYFLVVIEFFCGKIIHCKLSDFTHTLMEWFGWYEQHRLNSL